MKRAKQRKRPVGIDTVESIASLVKDRKPIVGREAIVESTLKSAARTNAIARLRQGLGLLAATGRGVPLSGGDGSCAGEDSATREGFENGSAIDHD